MPNYQSSSEPPTQQKHALYLDKSTNLDENMSNTTLDELWFT